MLVRVSAEDNCADRTNKETGPERSQRQHQRTESVAGRKERSTDGSGVIAEDHEVVHLQEVPTGDPNNGPPLDLPAGIVLYFRNPHALLTSRPKPRLARGDCLNETQFGNAGELTM